MSIKKITFLFITVFCLFIISNFVNSIYTLWHKKDVLIITKENLKKEEGENKQLKSDLARVKSQEFVEQEARDKLFLVKPGENVVIIPATAMQVLSSKQVAKKENKPNWQRWREMFFH